MPFKRIITKLLVCILLCAKFNLIASAPQKDSEESDCPQETTCEKTITWKKALLYSGVFIVGLVTFSLVAVENNN